MCRQSLFPACFILTFGLVNIALALGPAMDPYPPDGAIHPDTWVILSWTSGDSVVSHDFYFGTNYDAVAHADTADPTGIYRGRLEANSYVPPEVPLEWGQTYYWRIDAINDASPYSPWKGEVWSFDVVWEREPNLVGYWPFDEGSGSIAHDLSGNGRDATVEGATWATGGWDGAKWDIKATASKSQGAYQGNYGRHPAAAYNLSNTVITAYSCDTLPPLAGLKPRKIDYFYDEGDRIRGAESKSGDPYYRPAIATLPDNNILAVWWCDQQSPPYKEGEIWFSKSIAPEKHWITGAQIMDPSGPPYLGDRNPAVASPTGSPTMPPQPYP